MQQACENCRKLGEKLFIKGDRCSSVKCALTRRAAPAGVRGKTTSRRAKKSEYGLQLQEKQKAKMEYGLRERQFSNYFVKAARTKENTGEALMQNLELRLDNVIYRSGWTRSRSQARQLVNHGHILINGKKLDIPSYQVRINDKIEPANKDIFESLREEKANVPSWLKVDNKKWQVEIKSIPAREEIDTPIDEQLIVEFYSR